jgi:hypothetical protein
LDFVFVKSAKLGIKNKALNTQLTNNPSQKSPKFALFTVHV